MNKMFIWLYMLFKRQLKKLSLYVIIIAMILGTLFIRHIAMNYQVELTVGVLNEDKSYEVEKSDTYVAENIVQHMIGHKGLIRFLEYDDEEQMRADVQKSNIFAGYILKKDFWKKIMDNNMEESVKVITTPDSVVSKITNELVFSYVMREYTYDILLYDTYNTGYFEEEDDKKVAVDLRKAYEKNLTNGSTFSAEYKGAKEYGSTIEVNVFDYISPIIKGIIGVLIFLAALCGALILYGDKESGAFGRFTKSQTAVISLVEIFIPAFLTGVAGFACMMATNQYTGSLKEVVHMILYLVFVTLYSFLLNEIIHNKIIFLSLVPVFVMASLLFCHVFINLSTIVPEFKYISMILPPNYF